MPAAVPGQPATAGPRSSRWQRVAAALGQAVLPARAVPPGWSLLIDAVSQGGFSVTTRMEMPAGILQSNVTLLGDVTVTGRGQVTDALIRCHNQAVATAITRLERVQALLSGGAAGFRLLRQFGAVAFGGSVARWTGLPDQIAYLLPASGTAGPTGGGWIGDLVLTSLPAVMAAVLAYMVALGVVAACRRAIRAAIVRQLRRAIGIAA